MGLWHRPKDGQPKQVIGCKIVGLRYDQSAKFPKLIILELRDGGWAKLYPGEITVGEYSPADFQIWTYESDLAGQAWMGCDCTTPDLDPFDEARSDPTHDEGR